MLQHKEVNPGDIDAVLLNAKGFGGNNATASVLSPAVTHKMLAHKHGAASVSAWQSKNDAVAGATADYDERTCRADVAPIYRFDHQVRQGQDLSMSGGQIAIRGYEPAISLDLQSSYPDMGD